MVIYECSKCFLLLPYKSCFHNCTEDEEEVEEGFQESLDQSWYEEIKKNKQEGMEIKVIGANREYILDCQVIMILPNEPGKQYKENIKGHDIDGSWHIRRQGEEIPEGIDGIWMVEVGPGKYKKLSSIEAEEENTQQQEEEQQEEEQQEEYRSFRELFEQYREPYSPWARK